MATYVRNWPDEFTHPEDYRNLGEIRKRNGTRWQVMIHFFPMRTCVHCKKAAVPRKNWAGARNISLCGKTGDCWGRCLCTLKSNSFGEFVFDWAWADAYRRHGLRYYPKLVSTVPFTPVTGKRLLVPSSEGSPYAANKLRILLLDYALHIAKELGVSSLHCLFAEEDDEGDAGYGNDAAQDVQFHWQNPGYGNFDDFLAALSRDKRKRIKQERRKVRKRWN